MNEATTTETMMPSDLIHVWRVSSPAQPSVCVTDSESEAIGALFTARKRAWKGWRSRPNGYELAQAASRAYEGAGERLRKRLPFVTTVAYAYSPRENVGSQGADHVICGVAVQAGRLRREAGDALCKPQAKFWGLTELGDKPATCLKCLEIAERIAALREFES